MVSQHWAAMILLVSLVLLPCWMTASAQPHDHTLGGLSPQYRARRTLDFRTREKVAASSQIVKDSLSVIKDVVGLCASQRVSDVLKSFAKISSLAPGIGGLVASFLNVVLAFIPQENPLAELKKGFAEVNRKLDSLSIQISNLATDVEWFNYASVYSRDEVSILNAWEKFKEFQENSDLVQSEEEKVRLAEIFVNYYEDSGAESSVSNLYRYLTVNSTSLSENLNNLLIKKFKCDISLIGKYNLYFSSLLWKGMVLNQFYWKLIGFNTASKEAEHVKMFKTVSEAQTSAVEFCLNNYERFMREDVVKITKGLNPNNKKLIADQVKKALDKKYSWYSWVVVVYSEKDKLNHFLYDAVEIDVDQIIVAISYTLGGNEIDTVQDAKNHKNRDDITSAAKQCFEETKQCESFRIEECITYDVVTVQPAEIFLIKLSDYTKVIHASYKEEFVEVPPPLYQGECSWRVYGGKISFHYSRKLPVCSNNECKNGGKCERLLDSNEWFCKCQDGYTGDTCETRLDMATPTIEFVFPPVTTIEDKLKVLESKLDDLMNRCQRQ
ncbi:cephalotoxin-like protein [Kryptolebias marmoratus]|uniref:Cephalotoxin-like protein n=1 Tax=Kryptolebias marmoratus TaxID=37003 RepID=A0A3Q3B3A3_KRYMA|nr:cephalotoxin-like protein [Kryptolebias marmoratus]